MPDFFHVSPDADDPWTDRYRTLRRRVEALEEMFSDAETFDRIQASGRYFKLVCALAQAHEQIEREFAWLRTVSER